MTFPISVTIPTPYTVYHQVFTAGASDAHGNPVYSYAAPVARQVQAINEFGRRGSSHEIVSPDFDNRAETVLEMAVPDPSLYSVRDLVIVGATGVDGDGNPIGGNAYHVEGLPSDNRFSPFPLLNNLVGGAVRIRRVT